jgi:hypothetical protein
LYIANRCQADETFGAVKLNKLLFYSDFLAYLNFGKAITGQEYFKLPKGPCPRRWLPVKAKMIARRDMVMKNMQFHGFSQSRTVPLREPKLDMFTAEEIALVEKVITAHWSRTASEISDESHGFLGWKLAADEETIPYSVALVSRRPLAGKDWEIGRNLQSLAESALKNYGEECPSGG